jgi:hypothetical protein
LISLISGANQPEQGENRSIVAKARPGIRFNEAFGRRRRTMFRHACQLGLEGIGVEAQGVALPLRPLTGLAQEQEPERAGGDARPKRTGVRTLALTGWVMVGRHYDLTEIGLCCYASITRTAARAASGHAAAPPRATMNSRRFIRLPGRRVRAASAARRCRAPSRS